VAESTRLDVSVERTDALKRRMTVRVPSSIIEREVDVRLAKVGKTAKLKGFRPGKVPKNVIRQRYGLGVRQEVLSDVIRSSYSRAIDQEGLKPAGNPAIEALPEKDNLFAYRAEFEVYPDVELQSLDKLVIERPEVAIGEADIDDMIEKLRVQRAEWRSVERKSAVGDRINIDFVGKIGGEPFEGSESKDVTVTIGEGQVIEDFDKALKGAAPGAEKNATVKFPKDYANEKLAGQKAVFEIAVNRVEERVLPEVDEAFMEAFGVSEGGVEALRADVRGNMQRELNERLRAETKTRVLDALLAANKIGVPQSLVDEEIGHLQADAMRQLGISDPAKAPGPERFTELAVRRVSLGLLVDKLISDNEIVLDRDRVDERIEELVSAYDQPAEAARAYRTNRELMAQVESSVLEDQVVDFVIDRAKTKSKKLGFKEFMDA
jgi:trigger factor